MPSVKLTKAAIAKLKAPTKSGKQELVWDTELRGFGVLLSGTTNARSYVVQRTLPDGHSRRLTVGSLAEIDLDKARSQAADLINDMRRGVDPKQQRRSAATWTLKRALEEYLKARKNLKPNTVRLYRFAVERHLAPWLDRPLSSITADTVEDRHRAIQAEVEKRRGPLPEHFGSRSGAHMANDALVVFRLLWNFVAEREESLGANPVRRLRRQWYPAPRRERVIPTEALPAFYRAAEALSNRTVRDYILLLLFTGLRREEAAALSWSEIDFNSKVVRLPASRTKASRRLDLPMSSFVRDLLVARRAIGREDDFVFASNAKSGHLEDPDDGLKAVAKQTGVRVSSHDLRRTFVTIAESTDISVMALKALVNHSLGSDVTSGYVIATTERLREPCQRVCDRLMALCGITGDDEEKVTRLA